MSEEQPPITSNFFAIIEQFEKPGDAERAFKANYPMFFNPDGSVIDITDDPHYVPRPSLPLHVESDKGV